MCLKGPGGPENLQDLQDIQDLQDLRRGGWETDIMVQSISLRLPNNPYVAQHVLMISNFPNSGISNS